MNNTVAVIQGGRVSNLIVADDQGTIDHFGGVIVPDGVHVEIGWNYDGISFSAPPIPVPTQTEQFKALEAAIAKHMDEVAQSRGYDNRDSCRMYAGYVNTFQAEGVAFGQWVAACWVSAFQQQALIKAGTLAMPTAAEAVAALPAMVWPA